MRIAVIFAVCFRRAHTSGEDTRIAHPRQSHRAPPRPAPLRLNSPVRHANSRLLCLFFFMDHRHHAVALLWHFQLRQLLLVLLAPRSALLPRPVYTDNITNIGVRDFGRFFEGLGVHRGLLGFGHHPGRFVARYTVRNRPVGYFGTFRKRGRSLG